jgi:outer membrane lipoprotein-sorting protein
MLIIRTAIAAVATLGLSLLGYAAFAGPAAKGQAASALRSALVDAKTAVTLVDDRNSGYHAHRRYRRSQVAPYRYRWDSDPPYSDCYMNCINSGHPADFCQNVSYHFCNF